MTYKDLKQGDVIVLTNYGNRIVILDRIENDETHSSPQLYTYVELNQNIPTFEKDNPGCFYLLEDIILRQATEVEKTKIYNVIGKYFTEEYDKYWYNHFTDSSYFDILDYLLDVFRIDVYENGYNFCPVVVGEIQQYIWNSLCRQTGNYHACTDYVEPEMVNKQEFIEKAVKYLEANFPDIENVGKWYKESFINNFRKVMEE